MPKCGTTALAAYLQRHPDVLMSVPKEPHYFDAYYEDFGVDEYVSKYYGHFKGETIIGEATPVYLRAPWALERLAEHFPKAKHIALLRNPVDRAYSHWWMFYSRAMDPLTFEEAIEACIRQGDDGLDNPQEWKMLIQRFQMGKSLIARPYLSNGYYAQFLKNYLQWFNREQLLVIQTEEMNRDTPCVYEKVCQFLEIEPYQAEDSKKHNEAYGMFSRHVFKMVKGLGLIRFTQSISESARDHIKRVLAKAGRRQPVMNPETRARLLQHYAPHNRELEELLGRRMNWK
jgi:hypothetical protein